MPDTDRQTSAFRSGRSTKSVKGAEDRGSCLCELVEEEKCPIHVDR